MEHFFCGDLEASQAFYERNKAVIEAATGGHDFCLELLNAAHPLRDGQTKTVIWRLAASCLKEFEEIVLLTGNGFGFGAVKLMRSFYERVVTLSYLVSNPAEVQQFIDYSDIHWHKLLREAEEIHSEAGFNLAEEERKRILESYELNKDLFMQTDCRKCGTKRPQASWTKLDTKTMATRVSDDLRRYLFNAYLAPTFHLHTTYWGIIHQLDINPDGTAQFLGRRIQEEAAQEAFEQAYILLTQVMDVLNGFFQLNQQQRIVERSQAWGKACEVASVSKAKGEGTS